MANKARALRSDETFVMEALTRTLGGAWTPSLLDPPDACLHLAGEVVSVEIAQLTQHVELDDEVIESRRNSDEPVLELMRRIERALAPEIPEGRFVGVVLRPPLKKFAEVKRDLEGVIRERLREGVQETKVDVHGNRVEISIREVYRPPDRARLVGIVANRLSDPDILKNAQRTLALRLEEKARKCEKVSRPMWLALFNDYFLADAATYRQALAGVDVPHDFSRILLVEGSGKVTDLMAAAVETLP